MAPNCHAMPLRLAVGPTQSSNYCIKNNMFADRFGNHAVGVGAQGLAHDVEVLNRDRRRVYETTDGAPTIEIVSVRDDAVSARYIQHLRRQIVMDPNGKVVNQQPDFQKGEPVRMLVHQEQDDSLDALVVAVKTA